MSDRVNVADIIENSVEDLVPIDIIKIESVKGGYLFKYYENLDSDEFVHEGFASLKLSVSTDRRGDMIMYELEVLLDGIEKPMSFSGQLL